VLFGYASGSSATLTVNEIQEQAQVSQNRWQIQSQNLEVGLNEVGFNGDTSVLFEIDLNELPVTALDSETIILIVGICVILLGVLLYYKYSVADKKDY
jgi:predicted RND superfamily exporter protein